MKTILITGCSTGFGKMAVIRLLGRGHRVIAALRGGQSRLETTFAEELKRYPGKLIALDLHMEKPESFEEAALFVRDRFGGRLDVLINNAGYGLFGAVEDATPAQIRHQMEVNFFGPTLLTRALLPQLRAARGRVINLSSVCGRHGLPGYTLYNASKFALEGLTEAMHYELKPHGVQVGVIEPGGFRTDFSTRSGIFGDASFTPESPYRAQAEGLSHFLSTSSHRLGDPMRVVRLITRSVERSRLPVRQTIGIDARLMQVAGWLIPLRIRMAVMDLVFRWVVFRA